MVYVKQTWVGEPAQTTPISADRLNHLETQYDEAKAYTDSAIETLPPPTGGVDVSDFGAKGDGVSDDTAHIQAAINSLSKGGTVTLGKGVYYLKGSVELKDGVSLLGFGAVLLKKLSTDSPTALHGLSTKGKGYGSGPSSLSISGVVFQGDLTVQRSCVSLHHSSDIVFFNCKFLDAMGEHHAIDLQGCNRVTVDSCVFSGQVRGVEDKEAIQVDHSTRNGATYAEPVTTRYDGLPCDKITVIRCSATRSVSGVAPNLVGSHSFVEGMVHSNISVLDNFIEVSMNRNPSGAASRGSVHFVQARGIRVLGNTFECIGSATQHAFKIRTGLTALKVSDVGLSSPSAISVPPITVSDVVVSNNSFRNFNYAGGTFIAHVFGEPASGGVSGDCDNIVFSGNTFKNCAGSGSSGMVHFRVERASTVQISGNVADRFRTLAHFENVTSGVISGNVYRGGEFRPVSVRTNSTGVAISGNSLSGSADVGVMVEVNSKGVFTGNILSAGYTSAVSVDGTSTFPSFGNA